MEQQFFRIRNFCQKLYGYGMSVGKFDDLV